MAYDEELADRVRDEVTQQPGVAEKRMFGGLAFLVRGHMAVAASHDGGILVRVDPDESEALVAETGARPMEMNGRPMAGWLRVGAEDVGDERELERWVRRGATYAGSLPPKS